MKEYSKQTHNIMASRKVFDDSELAHPIKEEEFIKLENIKGKLLMIAAEDDSLWDASKYIRRAQNRLDNKPHECEVETLIYKHGTHYVFPHFIITKKITNFG